MCRFLIVDQTSRCYDAQFAIQMYSNLRMQLYFCCLFKYNIYSVCIIPRRRRHLHFGCVGHFLAFYSVCIIAPTLFEESLLIVVLTPELIIMCKVRKYICVSCFLCIVLFFLPPVVIRGHNHGWVGHVHSSSLHVL